MDRGDDVCTEFIYWLRLAGLVISHVIHLAAVNSQVVGLRANDLYQLDTNYSHSHHTVPVTPIKHREIYEIPSWVGRVGPELSSGDADQPREGSGLIFLGWQGWLAVCRALS